MKTVILVIAILAVLAFIGYFLYKKLTKNRAKLVSRKPDASTYASRKSVQTLVENDRSGYGSIGTTYPTSYPTPPKRVAPLKDATPWPKRDRETWDDDVSFDTPAPASYDYGSSTTTSSSGGSCSSPSYDSGSYGSSSSSSSSSDSGSSSGGSCD